MDQKVEEGLTIRIEVVLLINVKEMITMAIPTEKKQLQDGVEMKYKVKMMVNGEAIKTIIEQPSILFFQLEFYNQATIPK